MNNTIVNTSNTLLPSDLIESSVLEFKKYFRKTAESILEMGRVVHETKKQLISKPKDFEAFCSEIGFKPSSSSIKKLNQIGKSYTFMKSHADSLPGNWTTLYEISRLAKGELEKYIDEGVIHTNVLGTKVKQLNGSKSADSLKFKKTTQSTKSPDVQNGTGSEYSLSIQFEAITDTEQKKQLAEIIERLEALQVSIKISSDLKIALASD